MKFVLYTNIDSRYVYIEVRLNKKTLKEQRELLFFFFWLTLCILYLYTCLAKIQLTKNSLLGVKDQI